MCLLVFYETFFGVELSYFSQSPKFVFWTNCEFPLESAIVLKNRFNLSIISKLIKLFDLHCPCKSVVEKSNKENLKVIKKARLNKSKNPESLKT